MTEKSKSIDPATLEMLEIAKAKGVSTVFDRAAVTKPCPIGHEGNCCRTCFMGPCRLVGKTTVGVCGASLEVVQARNLLRNIAAGAAAHNDHGRSLALSLIAIGHGEAPGYEIKDERKLAKFAGYMGVETKGRSTLELAAEVGKVTLAEFGRQEGEILGIRRATPKRQELWRKLNLVPRGLDREVTEALHRTHMGTDQEPEHLLDHALRVALTDGWGGSLYATDMSDIIFGLPSPVASRANLGVLREDEVNIVIHGHEPVAAETILRVAKEPEMLEYAKSKGAKGINIAGMCCSGNEILMRHGIPVVGNFLQQEAVIATGAVDAAVVDYQCIMPGMQTAAEHYHTKVITTSPKVKMTGATHIEFDEHRGPEIARLIVRTAIDNFPKRKETHIPMLEDRLISGFSHEYIAYMQGGVYRESFRPLNDAVMQGRIRGGAGVVGCNNAQTYHDEAHINLVKEFIRNDVLVVTTGCDTIACAKYGLLTPEVMDYAGPGLREICQTIGIPPVIHLGSCIDNTRILTILTQMATEGGLGEDISDLPAIGVAPEWMSEKALTIGAYFVASGAHVIFGVDNPVGGSPAITQMVSRGWEAKTGGALEFEPDWNKILTMSLGYIDAKRKALKIADYDPKRFAKSSTYLPGDYTSHEEFSVGKRSRSA